MEECIPQLVSSDVDLSYIGIHAPRLIRFSFIFRT